MALLDLKKTGASTPPRDVTLSQLLWQVAHVDARTALRVLRTSEQGLTQHQVAHGLRKYGRNEMAHEQSPAWYRLLVRNFQDPFVLVLLVIGAVSSLTGDVRAMLIVSVMVSSSVLIRFLQEVRSSKAAARLQALVGSTATVTRQYESRLLDGSVKWVAEQRDVPFDQLVPGDLVHLWAGDMIPADLRLLTAKDLFVSQAALTGEAIPVEKSATP